MGVEKGSLSRDLTGERLGTALHCTQPVLVLMLVTPALKVPGMAER